MIPSKLGSEMGFIEARRWEALIVFEEMLCVLIAVVAVTTEDDDVVVTRYGTECTVI